MRKTAKNEPLKLEGEMTIYRTNELKAWLLGAPGRRDPLEVDLSGVTELDTAGLQLLLLAKKEAGRQNRTLRFSGHSPAVLEVLELVSNLAGLFGDPVVLVSDR